MLSIPIILFATILACLFAGPAKARGDFLPVIAFSIKAASPSAYIFSSLVSIFSSTIIYPLSFTANPASFARVDSGLIPMHNITMSAFIDIFSSLINNSSPSMMLSTPWFKNTLTEFLISALWTKLAISASIVGIRWLDFSTIEMFIFLDFFKSICIFSFVLHFPRELKWLKFSAISTPIYPPPTITTFFTSFFDIYSFILLESSIVLSVKILLLFKSLNGFIGSAPGDKTSLSYVSV